MKKLVILSLVCLPLLGFGLINLGGKDYDKDLLAAAAEEVKTTTSMNLLGPGGDPSVLYALTKLGGIVLIDQTTKRVPWISTAGVLINAPLEDCWRIATDFTTYSTFMPQVDNITVKDGGPNIKDATWTLGFKVGLIPFTITYSLRYFLRPPYRADFAAIGGGIRRNNGYYHFIPVEGGRKTVLLYATYSEPRSGFLQWVFKQHPDLELAANLSTTLVVANVVKRRVESILGREDHGDHAREISIKSMGLNLTTLEDLCSKGVLVVMEHRADGQPLFVTAGTAFNAPRDKVWTDITSYQDYPYYMPSVQQVKVVKSLDDSAEINYKLNMEFALFNYKVDYTVDTKYQKPDRISWTETKGSIKGIAGSWEFLSLADGKTLGFNRFTSDLRSMGWLVKIFLNQEPTFENAIQSSVGTGMLQNAKKWIEMPGPDRDRIRVRERKSHRDEKKDDYHF